MKKKLAVVALVVVLVALLLTGMTMAYFTDTDSATNVFTVGDIDIELTEPSWNPDDVGAVLPGVEYEKDPIVTNTGDNDAYVLVEITFTGYAGSKLPTDFLLNLNIGDNGAFEIVTNTVNKLVLKAKAPLAPNGELMIFDGVMIPADAVENELGVNFTIDVVAKAIQADGLSADAAYNELLPADPANP